jgi:phosphoserine aminotransferase
MHRHLRASKSETSVATGPLGVFLPTRAPLAIMRELVQRSSRFKTMNDSMTKPQIFPKRREFGSGPCAKRPGWKIEALAGAMVGRSHRAAVPKARLKEVIDRSRAILGIPATTRLGIVPASDTGAVEMALWSLLGPRAVEVLAWESFSQQWATDVTQQLSLKANVRSADYGQLPDLSTIDFDRDVVFAWNGTTSGVRVPNGKWIPQNRRGLTICDATSAAFAMHLPWDKLDVVTWSWQKVLGGEAAHGMLALSSRAVERLEDEPLSGVNYFFRRIASRLDVTRLPQMNCY